MKRRCDPLNNPEGSVTVAALLLLVVLTIIGISAVTTSNIEVQIATNDKIHKMAFYAADGGVELATELLELNLACPSGFASDNLTIENITVVDKDFWMQADAPTDADGDAVSFPADTERDVRIDADSGPHTNLSIFGESAWNVGGAIQMAAGYEGKGKGAGGGGVSLLYEIFSQHLGPANSESVVAIQWRHIIGSEGTCMY
ncbi:MAG: hypothetical protein JSW39_00400 [Desulfobacterales bacterium]|nr:MAG: hypothetical protein JSW39_00400 [Desulfobacterales bacterium]